MDVCISEEYVAQRRAERRAARIAAAASSRGGGGAGVEEKARAGSEQKRWAEKGKRRPVDGGDADMNAGGGAAWLVAGEDAVFSFFSA